MGNHISVIRMGGNKRDIVTIKGLFEKGMSAQEVSDYMRIHIDFINQYGQLIYHIDNPANTTTTDLSYYSDGLYIVKVYLSDKSLIFRLINMSSM